MNTLKIILGIELVGLVVLSVSAAVFWNMIKNGELRVTIRNKDGALAVFFIGLLLSIFITDPLVRGWSFVITTLPLLYFKGKYVLYLFKTLRK